MRLMGLSDMTSHSTLVVGMILFWIGWAVLVGCLIQTLRVIEYMFGNETEDETGDQDS